MNVIFYRFQQLTVISSMPHQTIKKNVFLLRNRSIEESPPCQECCAQWERTSELSQIQAISVLPSIIDRSLPRSEGWCHKGKNAKKTRKLENNGNKCHTPLLETQLQDELVGSVLKKLSFKQPISQSMNNTYNVVLFLNQKCCSIAPTIYKIWTRFSYVKGKYTACLRLRVTMNRI